MLQKYEGVNIVLMSFNVQWRRVCAYVHSQLAVNIGLKSIPTGVTHSRVLFRLLSIVSSGRVNGTFSCSRYLQILQNLIISVCVRM